MIEAITHVLTLLQQLHAGWVLLLVGAPFVGTLVLVPWLLVRLPADYFHESYRPVLPWSALHPLLRVLLHLGKNLLGLVVLLMGVAMLVLPGQGVLTIITGLLLLDFPGKYRFQRWLVRRGPVLRGVNWLRDRAGRQALRL
jgi:hypothetical protein